jgi:hypothetical protein
MFEKETLQPGLLESLQLLGATILTFESIKMNNRLEGLPSRPRLREATWQMAKQDGGRVEAGALVWPAP